MSLRIAAPDFASLIAGKGSPTVKICGIMRPEDALHAADCGAQMIGLVFAESRRRVSVDTARAIVRALRASGSKAMTVGVFVNESTERIREIAEVTGIDALQLSGDETSAQLLECASFNPVIRALRFPSAASMADALRTIASYAAFGLGDRLRVLIDAFHPGSYGGTGSRADWVLAAELARHVDIILAGGLTPGNVADAVGSVAPWGVDVSSGVERDGRKDPQAIRDFIQAVRRSGVALSPYE